MAAGLLVALAGLLSVGPQRSVGQRMGSTFARLGTNLLGFPLRSEDVDLQLGDVSSTFVVRFHQVTIGRESETFARAAEIGITVALTALFSDEPLITSVRVVHPDVNLRGGQATQIVWSAKERGRVLGLLARVGQIRILDGRVRIPGPQAAPLVLEGITGGLEHTKQGARLALEARIANGAVSMTGTVAGVDHDIDLTVAGRNVDASALLMLGDLLRGTVDFHIDVNTFGDALRAGGRLAVRGGHLLGRGAAAILHLGREVRESLARIDPALSGDDLVFDEARAAFTWRDGTWRFSRILVTSHEVTASGRARLTAPGELRGRGTLLMPENIAAVLAPNRPGIPMFHQEGGSATLPFRLGGSLAEPQISLNQP